MFECLLSPFGMDILAIFCDTFKIALIFFPCGNIHIHYINIIKTSLHLSQTLTSIKEKSVKRCMSFTIRHAYKRKTILNDNCFMIIHVYHSFVEV